MAAQPATSALPVAAVVPAGSAGHVAPGSAVPVAVPAQAVSIAPASAPAPATGVAQVLAPAPGVSAANTSAIPNATTDGTASQAGKDDVDHRMSKGQLLALIFVGTLPGLAAIGKYVKSCFTQRGDRTHDSGEVLFDRRMSEIWEGGTDEEKEEEAAAAEDDQGEAAAQIGGDPSGSRQSSQAGRGSAVPPSTLEEATLPMPVAPQASEIERANEGGGSFGLEPKPPMFTGPVAVHAADDAAGGAAAADAAAGQAQKGPA